MANAGGIFNIDRPEPSNEDCICKNEHETERYDADEEHNSTPAVLRRCPMTEDWRTADELDVERMIRQSTREIWDEKLVGKIYDYYADDVVVHGAGGDIVGSDALVEDTLARLNAFPETEMNIEKIIWEGNPEDGYYTSMVRTITAENTGPTEHGPPTGKTMEDNLGIANCLIQKVDGEWKYVEEWIVYDRIGYLKAVTEDDDPIHDY